MTCAQQNPEYITEANRQTRHVTKGLDTVAKQLLP
jgi:hypothetical protein